jgi:hypothetical protein
VPIMGPCLDPIRRRSATTWTTSDGHLSCAG